MNYNLLFDKMFSLSGIDVLSQAIDNKYFYKFIFKFLENQF